jgi:hypothetical protein
MGQVVRFPKENARATAHEEFEQNIRFVHDRIVEVTTEALGSVLFGCIEDFSVKVSDHNGLNKDLAVLEEAIQAIFYRQFGYEHVLHGLADGPDEEVPTE